MRVAASAGSSRCCAVDLDRPLPHPAPSLVLHSVWQECLQDFGLSTAGDCQPPEIVKRRIVSAARERLALGWALPAAFGLLRR